MEGTILSKDVETSEKTKYVKKYKCPYCELRLSRQELETHIAKVHYDIIPKGYSAARVAFNTVNKKEKGRCTICGKESPWNEENKRYDRLCGSKKCHDTYVKTTEQKTHRHAQMKNNPKVPMMMVNNRRNSNKYKFKDGGEVSYVGSYEKEFLMFMDQVMHFKSYEIITGMTIPYEFNGGTHIWNIDYYLPTYNLVIEIKDGGDNPNKAITADVRDKQLAKEKAIKKLKKYNYIRLTNKNHAQFIEMLLLLKNSMVDNDKELIFKINENSNPMMMGAMPAQKPSEVYIINYMTNNVFSEPEEHYALSRKYMSDIVTYDKGKQIFTKKDLEEFSKEAYDIEVYEFLNGADSISNILEQCEDDKDFYKILTGKDLLDYKQIKFDTMFKQVPAFTDTIKMIDECVFSGAVVSGSTKYNGYDLVDFPIFENGTVKTDDDILYLRNINGVYAKNKITGLCTPFFESVYDIPKKYINLIKQL